MPLPAQPPLKLVSITYRDPGTPILYGASEEMQVQAWKIFDKGNYDLAIKQAKALIKLWEPDAIGLEKYKESNGTFISYKPGQRDQLQSIHNYWALNDVAAAYFILGKIADQQHRYDDACQAFGTILTKFPLAQLWSTRGWFWRPLDSIRTEYVYTHPKFYGSLLPLIPIFPTATSLSVNAGNAKVSLSWKVSPGATSYDVERATVSGGPYTTIRASVPTTTTTYTDTALTNGTTYYYVVAALNSSSQTKANSNEESVTPRSEEAGTAPRSEEVRQDVLEKKV